MDVLRKPDTAPAARNIEFASADGLRLSGSLLEAGVPKVLLAHGFGQTRHSWTGTQQRLALGGYGSLAWTRAGTGLRNATRLTFYIRPNSSSPTRSRPPRFLGRRRYWSGLPWADSRACGSRLRHLSIRPW